MTVAEMKTQLTAMLDMLPEERIATVFDFVQFLTEREAQAGWLNAQTQSAAYQDWLSDDNDVYDEVFGDAHSTR